MNCELWALTLKYNPNDLTSDELHKCYDRYKDKLARTKGVEIKAWVEEDEDKKGRPTKLHVHGTLSIKRGVYRKKLQEENYHVKLKAVTEEIPWGRYMYKNVQVNMFKPHTVKREQSPAIPDITYNLFRQNNI